MTSYILEKYKYCSSEPLFTMETEHTCSLVRKVLGERGGGVLRMGNTCTPVADSCRCMAKLTQYCKEISLQLK